MQNHNKNTFTHVLLICLFLFTVVGYTSAVRTRPERIKPDFKNVDVFVERDRGDNENMVLSTVFDKTETENPYLMIFKANGANHKVFLMKGIIVRIFDHESGELLKTYIGADFDI